MMNPANPRPWRDGATMRALIDRINSTVTRPWHIMEVCGGQTWTLSRYRLEEVLPDKIRMIHGPGCPVCVTPAATIDAAVELARRSNVTLCSFGDMLRVPGTSGSLLRARAEGADVRLLYSPLEALTIAHDNPGREIVFLAIGFETTTPAYALAAIRAGQTGIGNFSLLTSLFTVPAAVRSLKADPDCRIDALLAAGHVCAVTGLAPYEDLSRELNMPVVVTGFEPVDMLMGILRAVEMLERGEAQVANAYGRVVAADGAVKARMAVDEVFEPYDAEWRGIGEIPLSGMRMREAYARFDARRRFGLDAAPLPPAAAAADGCIAHLIMKGKCNPADCPHFAKSCTPDSPVGAPMVSAEGVCAAHFRYNLH